MARHTNARSKTPPKYRLHKRSGTAVVTVNGTTRHLGEYGSEQSRREYQRILLDEWNKPGDSPKPTIPKRTQSITVSFLAIEFAKHCKKRYQKDGEPTNEWFIVQNVLKAIRGTYGDLLASEFGPLRFKNYRQSLVNKGLARHTVKRYANHVVQMFSHANENELITVDLYQRIRDAYGHHVTPLAVHRDLFTLDQIGVVKLNNDSWSFSAIPESDLWPFGGDA